MNIRKHIDSLGDTVRSLERVIIDAISAITPWLAPVIPASMVYHNMSVVLGLEPWVSLVGALAVEFLGLAAINTAVEFWRYNEDKHYRQSLKRLIGRKKNRKFNGAPFFVAFLSGLFYIVVVLVVNAVLDLHPESTETKVLAKALLSLLSVDAGIIIAIRASHSKRTGKNPKMSHNSHATTSGTAETPIGKDGTVIPDYETYMRFNESRNGNGAIPPVELIESYGVPKSTAYRWYAQYNSEALKNEH